MFNVPMTGGSLIAQRYHQQQVGMPETLKISPPRLFERWREREQIRK
jgi:hypothetical protein